MANVFGILTAIVLALAGFVAYKNQVAYKKEIENTGNDTEKKQWYDKGMAGSKEDRKQISAKAELGFQEGRLQIAKDTLASTLKKDEEVDAEVVTLTEQETNQTKTNTKLEADLKTKTDKVNANKAKLDEIREKTSKVGNINELAGKLRTLNADLEQLAQDITAADAKLANLTADDVQTVKQIDSLNSKFKTIADNRSLPTLSTRIRSIYPTWGFVTLGTGNLGGVVSNSTLDVVRDGNVIAKLLVTAVERNTASASIIPDSVAKDTTLMVGDKVVPSASQLGSKAEGQPTASN